MDDNKQLIINLVSNVVAFSSSFIISFILTPYLINHIGKEAYSFYPMSNNFIGYISIITIALNSMLARFISINYNKRNYNRAKTFFSSSFYSNVILVLILIPPMLMFILNIDEILNIPKHLIRDIQLLFYLVFFSLLIDLLSTVFGVATFVRNRLDLRALFEILKGMLKVILFLILFYFFDISIVFVGIVAVCVSIFNLSIQYTFSRKLMPEFIISISHVDFDSIKVLLSSGFWNVINALGVSLLLGMALFLTNRYLGPNASGDLSLAMMLPAFITTIISMMASVLIPRMTKIYATNSLSDFISEIVFSQKILTILTTIPILILIVFSDDFFKLWLPNDYSIVLTQLSIILLIPLTIHSNMWCVYSANVVVNKLKKLSVILLGVGVLNVFICVMWFNFLHESYFVIPLISVVTNVIYYLIIVPVYTAKNLDINNNVFYNLILKSLLFSIVFVSFLFYVRSYIYIDSWLNLFSYSIFFCCIGYIAHLFVVLNKGEILSFFKMIKR